MLSCPHGDPFTYDYCSVKKSSTRSKPNQVRIIGGDWRGRKLTFPTAAGLRPTPDRVRETLFNWLQAYLPGARCLDLFAGSGVLGLEALSRGASSVTFVERERSAINAIKDNVNHLAATDRVLVHQGDALQFIQEDHPDLFDIIFLDPPYDMGLSMECLQQLDQNACLKSGGLLYLEHESKLDIAVSPEKWLVLKNKSAGQVCYSLLKSV